MSKRERIRELEAGYATLQRGAAGILEQRDAMREVLLNQRARLLYEIDVITGSLHMLHDLADAIDVALGVSPRPGSTPEQ